MTHLEQAEVTASEIEASSADKDVQELASAVRSLCDAAKAQAMKIAAMERWQTFNGVHREIRSGISMLRREDTGIATRSDGGWPRPDVIGSRLARLLTF